MLLCQHGNSFSLKNGCNPFPYEIFIVLKMDFFDTGGGSGTVAKRNATGVISLRIGDLLISGFYDVAVIIILRTQGECGVGSFCENEDTFLGRKIAKANDYEGKIIDIGILATGWKQVD